MVVPTIHRFPSAFVGVYAEYLEKRCRETTELQLENTQCALRRINSDQIFTLQKSFHKSRQYAKDVCANCFVDLGKACFENALRVLRTYSVDRRLLLSAKSVYSSQLLTANVEFRQGCVLLPLPFIFYIRHLPNYSPRAKSGPYSHFIRRAEPFC